MTSATLGPLSEPFTLSSGLVLPNRLVKTALAEGLASSNSEPNAKHSSLYSEWGQGGWGGILTGNIQVDAKQLGSGGDVAVSSKGAGERAATLATWKKWADDIQRHGTPAIAQLNHPGRQAPRPNRKGAALAPSAVPLDIGAGTFTNVMRSIAFGTPKAMSEDEIKTVIKQFVDAALLASEAGFKGIQLHAAHGYLLAQFLSSISNTRTDTYGGSAVNRARIVREIIEAIRAATPATFSLSIKINSADHQQEGGLQDCLDQVEYITQSGAVDFLEISGGSYENPRMMSSEWAAANEGAESHEVAVEQEPRAGELKATERTFKREAFFLEYAEQVRAKFPSLPLMVTGGFRSRVGMRAALEKGGCDIIGLGRPAVAQPRLPVQTILNSAVEDDKAEIILEQVKVPWLVKAIGIKPLNAGVITVSRCANPSVPIRSQNCLHICTVILPEGNAEDHQSSLKSKDRA